VIAIDLYPEQQAYRPYLMTRTQTSLGSTQEFTYALNVKTNALPMTYVSLSSKIDQGPTLGTAGLVTKVLAKEEYQHQTGRYDFVRNEFLGYRTFVKTVFADAGVLRRHEVEYESDNEVLRGLEKSNRTFAIIDGKDVLHSEVTSDNKQSELFNNIFLRFLKAKSVRTLEEGGEKTLLTRFCTEIYPDTKLTKSVLSVEYGPDNKEYRANEVVLASSSLDNWQAGLILVKSIFEYAGGAGRRVAAEANRYENFRLTQRDRWYDRQGESGWEPLGKLSYDAYGNVRSYNNAEGMLTEIDYSNGANVYPSLVTRTVNGYRGPISLSNRYSYDLDAGGLLTGYTDENEQETSYAYDGAGRIKSQTLAGQSEPEVRWDYSYGSAQKFSTIHSYVRVLGANPASIQVLDGLMRTVASVSRTEKGFKLDAASIYDSFGKVVQTAENMPLASYTNPEALAIPATFLSRAVYDGLGRNIRTARPWATASSGVRTIQLLIDRRIMINEQGEVSVEVLDAFNRPCGSFQISKAGAATLARKLSCVGPIPTDGSVIGSLVSYDVRNQIVGLEFPSDKRSYEYDSFGRMRAVSSSLFGSYEFVFNRLDKPVARFHRDPSGKALGATFSQFDGMGRETSRRSLANFSGDLVRDLVVSALDYRFFYDDSVDEHEHTNLKGRLAALEIQSFARYDYSYDPLGNQNHEVLQLYGKKLKTVMNHDSMGRLTRIAFPDESEINYEYASSSQLNPTGVKFYGESIQIQSNEINIISEISAVGRFQMSRSMDFARQVVTGISSRGVTGDELQLKLSNLDGLSRPLELSGYFSKEINASVTYDDFGRLASVSSDSNRSDFAKSLIYKYDASSRLISASNDFAFDSVGRLTQSPLIKGVDWASDNRLLCVRSNEAASIGYSYQPDGRVFGIEEKGPNARSLVYVNKFLEFDRLSGKFKKILWIGGERVAEALDTDSVIYFARDHISTNRAQYAKASTFDLAYDPWGRILTTPEDKKSFYGFADGRQETALGVVHFNARYYAPEIGAFVNPDEFMIFNPMTCFLSPIECNLYSYARNNPLKYTDPTGKFVIQLSFSVKGGAAAQGSLGGGFYANFTSKDIQFGTFEQLGAGVSTGVIGRGFIEVGFTPSEDPRVMTGINNNISADIAAGLGGSITVSRGELDGKPVTGLSLGAGVGGGIQGGYSMTYGTFQEVGRFSYKEGWSSSLGIPDLPRFEGRTDFGANMLERSPGSVPDTVNQDFIGTSYNTFNSMPSKTFHD
jgi:RHS repeat-associated protein